MAVKLQLYARGQIEMYIWLAASTRAALPSAAGTISARQKLEGWGCDFLFRFQFFFKFRVTVFGTENDIDFYHGFLVRFLVLCRDSILLPSTRQKCVTDFGTENDTDFCHGFLKISTWF